MASIVAFWVGESATLDAASSAWRVGVDGAGGAERGVDGGYHLVNGHHSVAVSVELRADPQRRRVEQHSDAGHQLVDGDGEVKVAVVDRITTRHLRRRAIAAGALDSGTVDERASSAEGGALAGAFSTLDNVTPGDTVTTLVLDLGAPLPSACVGDREQSGAVSVAELVTGVATALGNAPPGDCPAFDANGDDRVTVAELIAAVAAVLNGCG